MPLVLDTAETFDFILNSDKSKEAKPTFILRYLSHRDWLKAARLIDESEELLETSPSGETQRQKDRNSIELSSKAFDKTIEAFKVALVGWKNLGKYKTFDPEVLGDILSDWDAAEIRRRLLDEMTINELDKKKAVWQSLLNTEKSAITKDKVETAPASKNL